MRADEETHRLVMSNILKDGIERRKQKAASELAAPAGSACCDHMRFALEHAIIRQINGPYFGADVMPPQLTKNIVACPWCGKPVTQNPI